MTPKEHAKNLIYENLEYIKDFDEDNSEKILNAIELAMIEVNNELEYMEQDGYDPFEKEHLEEVIEELKRYKKEK